MRGSQEDIQSVFARIESKVTEAIVTLERQLLSEQKKLNKLQAEKNQIWRQQLQPHEIIEENENILHDCYRKLSSMDSIKDEKLELLGYQLNMKELTIKSKQQDNYYRMLYKIEKHAIRKHLSTIFGIA